MPKVLLQAHSQFSLLAGTPSIEALVTRARQLGYAALALTDVNRMSGLVVFYAECLRQSIQPILGAEIREAQNPGNRLTLLARNEAGYGDLCELITQRHLHGTAFSLARALEKPWPHLFLVSEATEILDALSRGPNRARLFGASIRHSPEARLRARATEAFCARAGLPVVAAGDVWFLDRREHTVHRILRAIDLNSTLSRLRPGETEPAGAWMRAPAELDALYDDHPQLVRDAEALAERCHARPPTGKWIQPEIPVPQGHTPDTWLADQAGHGLRANYGGTPHFERAEQIQDMELSVIEKLGYASYFLMVKDVYEEAGRRFAKKFRTPKDCSLLRGSAANSITFYNLGVGRLDPIRHKLYFQRFLNEDRASPPDADLDFGWDEREEMLAYMAERFGRERVAITCTFNHFHFPSAFRETAKVFGYSEEQVRAVLNAWDRKTQRRDDEEIRGLRGWAAQVEGRPRFLGQHPGGLLITNGPIWRHVACEGSGGSQNRLITQVDMHSGIDALGLIKFDLLGNGSLSVLRDTLAQIEEAGLPDPEVGKLEKCLHDPATRRLVAEGGTRGVFYIESPAQIRLNRKAQADQFDDVVITSSLVRPAGTAYAKTFVERRRQWKLGITDWEFVHPKLKSILGDTHDVCAFQEDVIRICHEVAGLSYKKSDAVRKRMNSQHEGGLSADALDGLRREFLDGCRTNGLNAEQALELWRRVSSFTGFSFCKSHSASYAQLSFQCAWLKAHHPAEFLSAVISNNHGYYRREVYLNEARRLGLRVRPVDINHSHHKYHGHERDIRAGFVHVRGLAPRTLTHLLEERAAHGPFRGLEDFLRRVPAGKSATENLIRIGAFDAFGLTQPELLFHLDGIYASASAQAPSLFGPGGGYRPRDLHPGLRDITLMQRCLAEQRLLGYMLSGNPLDVLGLHPAHQEAVPAAEIPRHAGRNVKVFGLYVTARQHRVSKSGRLMQFLTLEDQSGHVDVVFWPDMLDRCEDELAAPGPFEVWGRVSEEWDTFTLEAERVRAVPFTPNLVDFERASARLRAGLDTVYAAAQAA